MTLPMARDLGKFKIRVMTIAPGIFRTPMGSGINEKVVEFLEKSTPLGRLGESSEFALIVRSVI
jgi:NAD(P)-dependent dehydrogenase (short-subunit alcohol dehydrogenase family)